MEQDGGALTVTVAVPFPHPMAVLTTTSRVAEPVETVVQVMALLFWPVAMIPLVIDQLYVAPVPASGTEAA
jgi:hypothetical protein